MWLKHEINLGNMQNTVYTVIIMDFFLKQSGCDTGTKKCCELQYVTKTFTCMNTHKNVICDFKKTFHLLYIPLKSLTIYN